MSTPFLHLDVPPLAEHFRTRLAEHIVSGWQTHGACRDVLTDAWFPDAAEPVLRAAAVGRCGECAVRRSCLAFALSENEDHGVWGGTTEVQRAALRIDLANGVPVDDVLDSATIRPAYLWRRTA